MLTTQQAADRLGLTRGRVIQLIWEGTIRASKFGYAWQIKEEDLDLANWNRKPGAKPGLSICAGKCPPG